MSRRGNAPVSPTGKTSKMTINQSINQSTAMSALYITALLIINFALGIHLIWDSAFVQSVNQSINHSMGFAYFSPSIEAFTPSLVDHSINQLTLNTDGRQVSAESLYGNARATWRVPSPLDQSINVHPADAELLSESLLQSTLQSINQSNIPNIAHFVIGATHSSRAGSTFDQPLDQQIYHSIPEFSLINYLSIKSAADLGGFDGIACHLLGEPVSSVYWQLALPYCSYVELIDPSIDQSIDRIFGRPVHHASIKAAISRLRILMTYGGTAVENDVIFLRSFSQVLSQPNNQPINQLMSHELVLGYTQPARENWADRPDVSIVSAKTTSLMLAEWFETFRMYEDGGETIEQTNDQSIDGSSSVFGADVERWTHDLAHSMMLYRRHLFAIAPVEWWGKIYAREVEGQAKLYKDHTSLEQLSESTVAVHLWQDERVAIREQRQVDGTIKVTSVEEQLSNRKQVQSFADICEMAKSNLYGQVLKQAMLAGDRHTHTCD